MNSDREQSRHTTPRPASSFSSVFAAAAHWTSLQCGRASTFVLAVAVIIVWAITGQLFHYSDTWQLIINTGTTIVTFLMVFLIQNTQNRDSAVLHLKLDELIRVNEGARNRLLDLEGLSEGDLERLKGNFARLASRAPDKSLLQEAAEDLEDAGEGILDAQAKIAAAGKP